MAPIALLLLAAEPQLLAPEARLAVAFVPLKGEVAEATLKKALEPVSSKKGRALRVASFKRTDYPGLDADALEYTAHFLSAAERARLEKSSKAIEATLTWPTGDAAGLREAYEAIAAVAVKHDAIIMDREAATAFTPAAWKERRISGGWSNGALIGPMHFSVHMVMQDSGLVMLDTGGLPRFGIEDFEVLDVDRSGVNPAGELVNAIVQRLIEGGRPDAKGRFTLKLADLKDTDVKSRIQAQSFDNAKGVVTVSFVRADMSRGARPDTLEVTFPDCKGKDRGERLDCGVKSLLGYGDSVTKVDHDDSKVKAAMARAKAALKGYEAKVKKGLPNGELLLVKAPFPYADGNEWMWVDVQAWNGNVIRGRLENEPEYVKNVQAGSTVEVKADQVMDYMYKFADDSFFGNEVGRAVAPQMFQELGGGKARVKEAR